MKLLFDQNLSAELKDELRDLFPGSLHISDVRPVSADDEEIWEYARRYEFAIASTDKGFRNRSREYGHPPKVILMAGNLNKQEPGRILRHRYDDLLAFHENENGVLDLRRDPP